MRFFSILALTSLFSAPAFAADLGTYRPGSPYHSVIAPGADVCENQCAGDAQCRGWNYVKVNPRAPGVCEFNAKPASPIESSISISGEGASLIAPNVSIGSTNTVRVGTSPTVKARSNVRRTSGNRRVVRQAVPQQIRPSQTVARGPVQSLTAQQNRHRQASGHMGAPVNNPNQMRQRAMEAPYPQSAGRQMIQGRPAGAQQRLMRDPRIQTPRGQQAPQFNHALDGRSQMGQPQHRMRPAQNSRPPIGVPINAAPQAVLPQASANDPVTHENGQRRIREAEMAAVQRAAQARLMSVEQAQTNLFGSLNDDVSVPRSLLSLPQDQDAPIATSQARPTIAVSEEPLGTLAGG